MLDFDDALSRLLQTTQELGPLAAERVSLADLSGRVLAEEVLSPVNLPSADYSAMDGYALRAMDAPQVGVRLPIEGESRAGAPGAALASGTCMRIFTGAHIPEGADCVIMQENVQVEGGTLIVNQCPRDGENIRRAGEDLKKGGQVLPAGARLSPSTLGLLASAEQTEAKVRRRPRVAILCTGDELRPPGALLEAGSLAESNGYALAAHVEAAGGEARRCPLVKDDEDALREALLAAKEGSDLLLTVGGVSVGDYDLVRPVLESLGAELVFHKVRIKPGKPLLLMQWGKTLVLGLPGNPSSAQVTFALFGYPLLRALSGESSVASSFRKMPLRGDFKHKAGRRCFYRGRRVGDEVELFRNQSSGASTAMAWADCLVMIDEETAELSSGALVAVLAYSEL